MRLFETANRSWELFKSAIHVIKKNPRLIWFPFLILACTTIIGAVFISPIIVVAINHPPAANVGPIQTVMNYPRWVAAYAVVLYPISMFLATFGNVVFYSQVLSALNGGEVSVRAGLN